MRIFKRNFIIIFTIVLLLLVISQILLGNSFFKNKLSYLYNMESKYVYSEKDYFQGFFVIQVSNPSDNLFLLENGEKTSVLNKETNKVIVSDNSVIEIDGRLLNEKCDIKIIEKSENLYGFYEETIKIESNIEILGRFFVK